MNVIMVEPTTLNVILATIVGVISTCLLWRIVNAVERDANKIARAGTAFSNVSRYSLRLLYGHSGLNLY